MRLSVNRGILLKAFTLLENPSVYAGDKTDNVSLPNRKGGVKPAPFLTGFTLTELLVVVVIIAILASIATPFYTKAVRRAAEAEGIALLGEMRASAMRYYIENGIWSTNGNGTDLDWANPTETKYFKTFTFTAHNSTADPLAQVVSPASTKLPMTMNIYENGQITTQYP